MSEAPCSTIPVATRFTRATGDCLRDERLVEERLLPPLPALFRDELLRPDALLRLEEPFDELFDELFLDALFFDALFAPPRELLLDARFGALLDARFDALFEPRLDALFREELLPALLLALLREVRCP